jgi:hypothetical protein
MSSETITINVKNLRHLLRVLVALPWEKVLNLKWTLYWAAVILGKPSATMRVLERTIRFMERPKRLMGCSYIFV